MPINATPSRALLPLLGLLVIMSACSSAPTADEIQAMRAEQAKMATEIAQQREQMLNELDKLQAEISVKLSTIETALATALNAQGALLAHNAKTAEQIQITVTESRQQTTHINEALNSMREAAQSAEKRLADVTALYKNTKYIVLDAGGEKLETTQLPIGAQVESEIEGSIALVLEGKNSHNTRPIKRDVTLVGTGKVFINAREYGYADRMTFLANITEREGRIEMEMKSVTFTDSSGMVRTESADGHVLLDDTHRGIPVPGYTPGQSISFTIPEASKFRIVLAKPIAIVVQSR